MLKWKKKNNHLHILLQLQKLRSLGHLAPVLSQVVVLLPWRGGREREKGEEGEREIEAAMEEVGTEGRGLGRGQGHDREREEEREIDQGSGRQTEGEAEIGKRTVDHLVIVATQGTHGKKGCN